MEFSSQYFMLLHQVQFTPIVFSDVVVENKTPRLLQLHVLPQLGLFEWKSLESLEGMPQPSQALLLSRIEWEHFPCPTFLILTLELVSFPSFCPLPISSCLMSPSPRLQVPKEILAHVFLKSQTLIQECSPSSSQDTKHNLRNMQMSNLSTCLSYTLCYYLSLDLSIS